MLVPVEQQLVGPRKRLVERCRLLRHRCGIGVGDPSVGNGWELDAIAGVVIGGVSLYGGEGRIIGMVFGILLLMLINNALIVLNVSPFFQQVALGLVLGVAIVADRIRARSRGQARPRGIPIFGAHGSSSKPAEKPTPAA